MSFEELGLSQPILQAPDARDTRRGVLADAMPQQHRRLHPPGAPQLGQGVLQRHERRLGVLRLIEDGEEVLSFEFLVLSSKLFNLKLRTQNPKL